MGRAVRIAAALHPSLISLAMRRRAQEDSAYFNHHIENTSILGMGPKFTARVLEAEIMDLPNDRPDRASMRRYLDSGVTRNVWRQTQRSLDSAAPGIARYLACYDLMNSDNSPPPTHTPRPRG